jgi:hypothetical protein
MSSTSQRFTDEELNNYALITATAAAGCALGVLFGRGMDRKPANISALALLGAAAFFAGPAITEIISRTANRPSSERGSRRRLEGIRNAATPEGAEIFAIEDGMAA